MNRTTSSGTINIPMMMMNNNTANSSMNSLVENTFHSPPTMMMMGGLPTTANTTTPSSLSSNNSGGSLNNSVPIPIPSSSSTLTFKRKTSNAKYKPANLSISSVRDSKASKPTKQFEIPQEFYMYNHASSVPNQGYISSVDESNTMASPSPHSSSLITSAHYHNRSSSLQPQQPSSSINNLFQKSTHHHHHGMGQRQHTPFSPPSTSSAMMINRSSVSSVSSSFSNSSYNPIAHSHSSAAHHHSSSFVQNSLGHQYSSGYFNPHSYDNNSMCYSLSSSVESNCSYASHCISPNTGSLLLYDKLNRKFRKIRALGEGSSSTVSLVQQESTGLYFAEKVIEHYEEREAIVKNEVKYLSICKPCSNVVTLFDCFQKGDSIHLILEYMEGNSLDIIAKQYSKLSKTQRKSLEEETETNSSHLSPMAFDEDSELMTYDDDLDDLNTDEEMFPMDTKSSAKPEKKKSTRRKLFDDDEESDSAKNQRDNKGLPEEMLALMVVQITRALCFLMDHNIIHSDIKPSNILLNRRGEVKLTDFGLSTCTEVSQNRLGSFAYMSPEKLQHGKHSHKSDIYSLGVSILELSKFKFPFSESGFHMNEIQHLDVEKFVGNTHSHEFKDFIRQCIQIEPNVRLCAHELLQHDWLRNYANMDNDLICSKISKWYNKLS